VKRQTRVLLVLLLVLVPVAAILGYLLAGPGDERAGAPPSPEVTGPPPKPGGEEVSGENPFGIFLNPIEFDTQTRVRLAAELGARYFRSYPVLLQTWDGECFEECDAVHDAGLEYVLTIRNSPQIEVPASPVTSVGTYQEDVARIIDVFRPAVIAVENEEDVPAFFSGSSEQYLAALEAACEVAHRMDVPCTNGGITGPSVTYLVYQHLVDSGQPDGAQEYADRAFMDQQLRRLSSPDWERFLRERTDYLKAFILYYAAAGADYFNFHWYVADAGALAETVRYLEEATQLPAISNELGPNSEDAALTEELMQSILDTGVEVAIWYSRDARVARALVERDGRLRASGEAYAEFTSGHFEN